MKNSTNITLLVLFFFIIGIDYLAGQALNYQFQQKPTSSRLSSHNLPFSHPINLSLTGALNNENVRLEGRWAYGPCLAVAVSGDTAYFGNGAYLEIVDFMNPTNPQELGKILVSGPIHDIALRSNYAYLANGGNGLQIIDISNPALLKEVGYVNSHNFTNRVALSGNYAYITDGSAGLRIIDILIPEEPKEISFFKTDGNPCGLAVKDNYLYLVNGTHQLDIIDISIPSNPRKVNQFSKDTRYSAYDVSINNKYLYMTGDLQTIKVPETTFIWFICEIDISNVMNLQEVNEIEEGELMFSLKFDKLISELWKKENAYRVNLSDKYAYLTTGYNNFRVIDFNQVTNPQYYSHYYDTEGNACGVAINGNNAYIANGSEGLQIIDFSKASTPKKIMTFNTGDYFKDIAIHENYAYISNGLDDLIIMDISNTKSPQKANYFETKGRIYDLTISGDYAYLAIGYNGLQIIDLQNATNPLEVGCLDETSLFCVVSNGNYAYVAGHSALQVIDVSNENNPHKVGIFYPEGGNIRNLVISDNYVYVLNKYLQIIDVSIPSNPVKVGQYDLESYSDNGGIAVSGQFIYIANGETGLQIIDISDETNPQAVGYFDTEGSAIDVTIDGNYAYVADGWAGLRVIDISKANNPLEIGFFDTGSTARRVKVKGKFVYVTDGEDGLYILEHYNNPPDYPALSDPINNSFTNNSLPSLNWQVPSDLDGNELHFKIEIATDSNFINPIAGSPFESQHNTSGFNPTPPLHPGMGNCSFTLQNPLNETTYFWRVTARDKIEYGAASPIYRFTIDTTAPDVPTNLLANGANPSPWQKGDNRFLITWENPADVSGIGCYFYQLGNGPMHTVKAVPEYKPR